MSDSPSIDAAVAAAAAKGEVPEAEAAPAEVASEPAADTAQDTEDGLG